MDEPVEDVDVLRKKSRAGLRCPACGNVIALVGRRGTMRHPFAQMLEDHSFAITGWWCLLLVLGFITSLLTGSGNILGRGLGWGLVILPMLPGTVIWFLVRLFPVYRVTACPRCGFKEIERLGGRAPEGD